MPAKLLPPDYVVSPVPNLWSITGDGEALYWRDTDRTALMLAHLRVLAQPLMSELGGLPPLTALLFIVDAASKGWDQALANSRVDALWRAARLNSKRDRQNSERDDVLAWLIALGQMPTEFRHGARAQVALLCELLEQLPPSYLITSKKQTDGLFQWLEIIGVDSPPSSEHRLTGEVAAAGQAWQVLEFASVQGLDADALRTRIQTGLSQLPDMSDEGLSLPEPSSVIQVLRDLQQAVDPDLREIGRLAQLTASMLSLPRSPNQADLLPIGGVSDVTNRGQPERLLASELALDPDLMIARIANGQALYLRREYPPAQTTERRRLFIEAGIRTWGMSRIYLAAAALALCAGQERQGARLQVSTIAGRQRWDEDLQSHSGILAHFERLCDHAHPGPALEMLSDRWLQMPDEAEEVILLVTAATDRDPEFQRCLIKLRLPYLLVRVEPGGVLELVRRDSQGTVRLQTIALDARRIAPSLPSAASTSEVPLPGYLKVAPAPLQIAPELHGSIVQATLEPERRLWIVTADRRLLCVEDPIRGAIELGSLPRGKVLAWHPVNETTLCLVIEQWQTVDKHPLHLLVQANLNGRIEFSTLQVPLDDHADVKYIFDRGDLLRIGRELIYIDPFSGDILANQRLPYLHLGGPFFGGRSVYSAIRTQSIVNIVKIAECPDLAGVVARTNDDCAVAYARDLSWMLRLDGASQPQPTGVHIGSAYPPVIESHSPDRQRLLVSVRQVHTAPVNLWRCGERDSTAFELDLQAARVTGLGKLHALRVQSFQRNPLKWSFLGISLRRRFNSIGFADGKIWLRRADKVAIIQLGQSQSSSFELSSAALPAEPEMPFIPFGRSFQPQLDQIKVSWRIRHARLPTGDAWLDSRGLLHLRGRDGQDLTFMLCMGRLPGWHSMTGSFGPAFHVGLGDIACSDVVTRWFERFVKQQCGQ